MPASFTPAARKLAQELVQTLQDEGLTQDEIAERCGPRATQTTISRAKSGKGMQPSYLVALAKTMGRGDDAISAISDPTPDGDGLPASLKAAIGREPKSRVGIAAAKAFVIDGAPSLEEKAWIAFIQSVQLVPGFYVQTFRGESASKALPSKDDATSDHIEKRTNKRTGTDKSSSKPRKSG